jgi:hypothetical protein
LLKASSTENGHVEYSTENGLFYQAKNLPISNTRLEVWQLPNLLMDDASTSVKTVRRYFEERLRADQDGRRPGRARGS